MRNWINRVLSLWLISIGVACCILYFYVNQSGNLESNITIPTKATFMTGILAFVMGVMIYKRLHRRPKGILVNPAWVTFLYDGINLLFGVLGAYLFVNIILSEIGYRPPIVNDEYGLFMGTFYFLLGIPFVALYTSRLTGQSVEIHNNGIHVYSLFGQSSMSWDQIDSISLSDEYVAVGRVGILIPRKLQRRLKLTSKS